MLIPVSCQSQTQRLKDRQTNKIVIIINKYTLLALFFNPFPL